MTIDQIKALSDRELDAQIAEKVLGETVCRDVPISYDPECGYPHPTGRFAKAFDIASLNCIGDYCREYEEDEYSKKVPVAGGHLASCLTIVPEFSKSLDAIHPLEVKTVEKFGLPYIHALNLTAGNGHLARILASARHRAESVLYLWTQEGA